MGLFSKKKNNTTINDLGLDEAQYDGIMAGQGELGSGIGAASSPGVLVGSDARGDGGIYANQTAATGLYAETEGLATGQGNLLGAMQAEAALAQQRYDDALTAQAEQQAAANAAAAAAQAAQAQQAAAATSAINSGLSAATDDRSSKDAGMRDYLGGEEGIVTNLGTQVGTGFSDLGARFDTTDTSIGNLSEKVGTGMQGVQDTLATNNEALTGQVGTGFSDLTTLNETGFNALGNLNNENTGFVMGNIDTTRQDLTALAGQNQEANLLQQNAIMELINKYGGNADMYYQDLSSKQGSMINTQDGLMTDLGQFRTAFDTDAVLSNNQRAELSAANQYQTNELIRGQGAIQNQADAGARANQQAFSKVSDGVESGSAGLSGDFGQVARLISSGFQTNDSNTEALKGEFVGRLGTIRTMVSDSSVQMDEGLRQNYSEMVNSFDENGALIARTSTDSGDTISRAIDDNGNLLLSQFDAQGTRIGQQSMNINQMMAQLSELGYVAGSNTRMAQRSTPTTGQTFSQTYGN